MILADWLTLGEIGFGALAITPILIQDKLNRRWIKRNELPKRPLVVDEELPMITVIICVLNEEKVIAGKLSNLAICNYPRNKMEVLVIDTGSSDQTMYIVEDWIEKAPEFGRLVRLLSTTTVAGKSAAVNLGLAESHIDSEVIILTDADSRLAENSLKKITSWFANPEIGAVCGHQQPIDYDGKIMENPDSYRDYYNRARDAESRIDSTPIFEGSLAAYRRKLVNSGVIADSNADDSQLALEARRQGLRTIHDSDLIFYEATPYSALAIHTQKTRRAQGLVRHLWRNSDLMFNNKLGIAMMITIRSLFLIHVITPFLFVSSIACSLGLLLTLILGFPTTPLSFTFSIINSFLLIYAVIQYYLYLIAKTPTEKRRRFSSSLISYVHSMFVLVWVHVRISIGLKSHIWKPIKEIRDSIVLYDKSKMKK